MIKPQFEAAFYFHEGIASAMTGSDDLIIDRSGTVVARGYEVYDLVSEGRVPATHLQNDGYLDTRGREVIPFIYESVSRFSEGMAAVKKAGKWGYIDRDGRVMIAFQFEEAGEFSSGLAPAKREGKTGFIDRSGMFAFLLEYEHATGFQTGDEDSNLFIAPTDVSRFWTSDGRFGYVNTSGHIIWGPINESPDHTPLLGWSDADKAESCEGVPEETRLRVAAFPEQ